MLTAHNFYEPISDFLFKYILIFEFHLKTKTYFILFFGVSLSCFMFFNSCKFDIKQEPCPANINPSRTYICNLSDSNKAKIPYTETDTLIYISNTYDTTVLRCIGKYQIPTTHSKINSPSCGNENYWKFEVIEFDFGGSSGYSTLSFYFYYDDKILYTSPQPDGAHNNIALSISYQAEFDTTCLYLNSSSNYTHQININGKNYLGVQLSNGVVYNYKYGILQFKQYGKTWTLSK